METINVPFSDMKGVFKQSELINENDKIRYPGERVIQTCEENMKKWNSCK